MVEKVHHKAHAEWVDDQGELEEVESSSVQYTVSAADILKFLMISIIYEILDDSDILKFIYESTTDMPSGVVAVEYDSHKLEWRYAQGQMAREALQS